MRKGVWYAAGAYTCFGLFPLYWKALESVPALQTVCHRIIWSCLVLVLLLAATRRLPEFAAALRSRRTVGMYAMAATAIAINWFIYIWAVNAGFVVQTALGYYIQPLVTVSLAVIVLRERLRRLQWIAVGMAALGVIYLAIVYGRVPWIALGLGLSFGSYGLIKKTAPLDPVRGLSLETVILLLPAVTFLIHEDLAGRGGFGHDGTWLTLLMIGAGPVTTIPLLLFAAAVTRIPLSVLGMLQYINPTLQFIIGVFVYHEPFSRIQFVGFSCVWVALILFAIEGYRNALPIDV